MPIPTEPIGSIPRPPALVEAVARAGDGFRSPVAAGHVRRMPRLTRGPFEGRLAVIDPRIETAEALGAEAGAVPGAVPGAVR